MEVQQYTFLMDLVLSPELVAAPTIGAVALGPQE